MLAAATSAFFVNSFHTFLTGAQRKLAKVPYPTCYASAEQAEKDPAAFKFNCGMSHLQMGVVIVSPLHRLTAISRWQPSVPTATTPRT